MRRKKRVLPKFMTEDQIKRYLSTFDKKTYRSKRNYLYTALVLATGLRCSEVLDMTYRDFVLLEGTWFYYLKDSKAGTEVYIPLPVDIHQSLMNFGKEHSAGQTGFVFRKRTANDRLTVRAMQKVCNKHGELASLPFQASSHTLRHTYGRHLWVKTRDIAIVSKMLRHSSVTTTQIYMSLGDADKVEAMNAMKLY